MVRSFTKPNYFQIIGEVDYTSMLSKLQLLPRHFWDEFKGRKKLTGAKNTECIVVLNQPDKENPYFNIEIKSHTILCEFEEELSKIYSIVRKFYGYGEPKRVMFTKLLANKNIPEHGDIDYHLTTCRRVHLPLVTNEEVYFYVDGVRVPFNPGLLIEINNNKKHKVENKSIFDRIHLIIDWGFENDEYYTQR